MIDEDSIKVLIDLLDSKDIGLKINHVVYMDGKKIDAEKDTIFVSTDFIRPQKAFPLMSIGNNIEKLVKHAIVNHSEMVQRIIETTKIVSNMDSYNLSNEQSVSSLLEEYPVLITQILLGLYSRESYDEKTLLSQQTPYLSQEEINLLKTEVQKPRLTSKEVSKLKQFLPNIFTGNDLLPTNISDVNIAVSRSLDLVEEENIYSFATMSVDENGIATLYISEALLRELDKYSSRKKQKYLRNLAIHEIVEYITLSVNPNMDYTKVHDAFEQIDSQKELKKVVQQTIQTVLRIKQYMFEEVDSLLAPCDIDKIDSSNTIGFMLGSKMISAFEGTYQLYEKGKLGKIFISGSKRASLSIVKNLIDDNLYPENQRFIEGIEKKQPMQEIRTVKDLLAIAIDKNAFANLTSDMLVSVDVDPSQVLLLDENLTTPISKDEIFEVVSKDGVSEAAIIKWIILESARQDGKDRTKINQLIKSIVLETNASNTPENIANIFAKKEFNDFVADKEDVNIVIIQTPFSQTRAGFTLNKYLSMNKEKNPVLKDKVFEIHNMSFDIDSMYYHYRNVAALNLSLGEWTRMIAYSLKGDIIPIVNSKEGLNAIPLEMLAKIFPLITLLTDKERENLKKVFINILYDEKTKELKDTFLNIFSDKEKNELTKISNNKKLNDNEKIDNRNKLILNALLKKYSNENKLDHIKYDLIKQFIEYFCSDVVEQRLLEKEWEVRIPDIIASEMISKERIVNEMNERLQPQNRDDNPFYKILAAA